MPPSSDRTRGAEAVDFEPLYLLEDEPVRALESDHLGLRPFASVIAGAAIGTPGPFTIGVFAPWGEGKTSVLRLAKDLVDRRKKSDQKHVVTVWFNAWQFEREEHPIEPLLETIVDAVQERIAELDEAEIAGPKPHPPEKDSARQPLEAMARALRSLIYATTVKARLKAPLLGDVEFGITAKDAIEREKQLKAEKATNKGGTLAAGAETTAESMARPAPNSLYLKAFRELERVAQELARAGGGVSPKIAVFIDDLDRCLPPQGMALLESIKLVLAQPGFVFALAVDRRVLESYLLKRYEQDFGMKEYEQGSRLYLDKIVQLPLALPSHETRFEKYLGDLLAKSPAFQEGRNAEVAEALKTLAPILALGSEANPRNLVRFVNNLIVDFHLWKATSPREKVDATLLELAAVSRMLQQYLGGFYRELANNQDLCQACFDLDALAKREPAGRDEGWGRERHFEELKRRLGQKRVLRDLLTSEAGKKWLNDSAARRKVDLFLVTQREKETEDERSQREIIEDAIRDSLGLEPEVPITEKHRERIHVLRLSDQPLGDEGLSLLAGLTTMTSLDLEGTEITDAGLSFLSSLTALASLDLNGTRITDAGLSALSSLTSLTWLNVADTQITNTGLAHLAGLALLQDLNLTRTQITEDAGLLSLLSLTSLTSLNLGGTRMTDAGLACLMGLTSPSPRTGPLPALASLNLARTQVTDAGLSALSGLKSLAWLYLSPERVSEEAVERLRKERPGLTVRFV